MEVTNPTSGAATLTIDSNLCYRIYIVLDGECDDDTHRVTSCRMSDQNSTFQFAVKKRAYFANNLRWELDRTIRNTSSKRGNISLLKRFSPDLNRP